MPSATEMAVWFEPPGDGAGGAGAGAGAGGRSGRRVRVPERGRSRAGAGSGRRQGRVQPVPERRCSGCRCWRPCGWPVLRRGRCGGLVVRGACAAAWEAAAAVTAASRSWARWRSRASTLADSSATVVFLRLASWSTSTVRWAFASDTAFAWAALARSASTLRSSADSRGVVSGTVGVLRRGGQRLARPRRRCRPPQMPGCGWRRWLRGWRPASALRRFR